MNIRTIIAAITIIGAVFLAACGGSTKPLNAGSEKSPTAAENAPAPTAPTNVPQANSAPANAQQKSANKTSSGGKNLLRDR